MNIWNADAILLFIAFVIPGFVALKTYELLFPSEPIDSSRRIIEAVTYSCVNYAILLLPIYLVETYSLQEYCPPLYALFYVLVLLVAPIGWVWIVKYLRNTDYFQKSLPHPTAKPWDFVFGQRKQYWMLVTLKNGSVVGGKFGDASFASSAPSEEQLFLEKAWLINEEGGFERERHDSAGIIILASEIAIVELFDLVEEEANDRKTTVE